MSLQVFHSSAAICFLIAFRVGRLAAVEAQRERERLRELCWVAPPHGFDCTKGQQGDVLSQEDLLNLYCYAAAICTVVDNMI